MLPPSGLKASVEAPRAVEATPAVETVEASAAYVACLKRSLVKMRLIAKKKHTLRFIQPSLESANVRATSTGEPSR